MVCCVLLLCVLASGLRAQIELPDPLQGTYSVDKNAKGQRAFRDLATAVRYLALAGVKGSCELEVHPGTYVGGLQFFPVPGLADDKRVVIRAVGPGEVLLEHDDVLARFHDGASRIVLEGFTFAKSGKRPAILVASNCTDNEIRKCHFTAAAGSDRMVEIQGRGSSRRWRFRSNRFDLGAGISYGIYTQSTYELDISDNEFVMSGCREAISIWNANRSQSRIVGNVFRGDVQSTCLRLDVSGHDVTVADNLFYVRLHGAKNGVIKSQGLRTNAYNKIWHNVFVIRGDGVPIGTRGPIAVNANLYAPEEGGVGMVKNEVLQSLPDWQEAVAAVALDDQADQDSAVAGPRFFDRHEKLLGLFHVFADDDEPDPRRRRRPKLSPEAEMQLLLQTLKEKDPVALRLAIYGVLRHGRQAIAAVPALARLCGHEHAAIRASAVRALLKIRIGAEIVIPELQKLLADKDERVLLAAIEALGSFAHLAAESGSRLKQLTKHRSAAIRTAAERALRAVLGLDHAPAQDQKREAATRQPLRKIGAGRNRGGFWP